MLTMLEKKEGKSSKKYLWIIMCFIGLILVPFLIYTVNSQREAKLQSLFQEISQAQKNGNYQEALLLAKDLPEPYGEYYVDYVEQLIQINSWSGSVEEFFYFIKDIFDKETTFSEMGGYVNQSEKMFVWFDDYLIDRRNYLSAIESFKEKEEIFENALIWYPEFYELQVSFRKEFCDILIKNVELFAIHPDGEGIVAIPCKDIKDIDSRMQSIYEETLSAIDKIQVEYCNDATIKKLFDQERDYIEDQHATYFDVVSLSHIYSIEEGKSFVYVTAENASNNYNVSRRYIKETLFFIANKDEWNSAMVGKGLDPITSLIDTVKIAFPDANPPIEKQDYATLEAIVQNILKDWLEEEIDT